MSFTVGKHRSALRSTFFTYSISLSHYRIARGRKKKKTTTCCVFLALFLIAPDNISLPTPNLPASSFWQCYTPLPHRP